ncbi:MAG TPA: cell division protein ZapB [Bryobacteraceae bacterium]|jgi:hypothetical protein
MSTDNADLDRLEALHKHVVRKYTQVGLIKPLIDAFPALSRELRELREKSEEFRVLFQQANRELPLLRAENARLRDVLKKLRNEASGLLGMAEHSLRDLMGDTNVAVMQMKIAAATAELEETSEIISEVHPTVRKGKPIYRVSYDVAGELDRHYSDMGPDFYAAKGWYVFAVREGYPNVKLEGSYVYTGVWEVITPSIEPPVGGKGTE